MTGKACGLKIVCQIVKSVKGQIMKRRMKLIIVFLVISVAVLTSCEESNMRPNRALDNFIRIIEQGNISDLRLTIYHMYFSVLTPFPFSLDQLMDNHSGHHRIVVDGSQLEEHIELINQIRHVTVTPMDRGTRIDARLYYVFETVDNNRKVFDFGMWADDDTVFINGVQVKANSIFLDIIIPFLPENVADDVRGMSAYLGW